MNPLNLINLLLDIVYYSTILSNHVTVGPLDLSRDLSHSYEMSFVINSRLIIIKK
jgi:hypothetical protein